MGVVKPFRVLVERGNLVNGRFAAGNDGRCGLIRPLMYGYLRVDLVADRVGEWERRIWNFADREGFDLGTVFHERDTGRTAFCALIRELRRAESRHVVVPTMVHVWGPGQARHALVARLWHEACAGVWVADTPNHAGRAGCRDSGEDSPDPW